VLFVCLCGQTNAVGHSTKTVRQFLEKHYTAMRMFTMLGVHLCVEHSV